MAIHSDSISAISRVQNLGAGPGQSLASSIAHTLARLLVTEVRSAKIRWVRGHAGVPGSYMADVSVGKVAEKKAWSRTTSPAYLKPQISERYRKAKEAWHKDPQHHRAEDDPTFAIHGVLSGPGSEVDRLHHRTDPYQILAVCILPQEDPQAARR